MIHVFHIVIGFNVGGVVLILKRLIESHQGHPNYRQTVISLTSVGKMGKQLQAIEIEVQAQARGMRSLLDIPCVLWQLVRLIRASCPDIVQTWMYDADLWGRRRCAARDGWKALARGPHSGLLEAQECTIC